ncbi:methylated-DNA--[protein]-cysteine S-methyltransferase [Actinophytocola sp.]|uniref:methylated-DNA--[protein]-cysteine S-methyltransferase n=1 Tax=Actinophytocola sp. TaxID=1872138 RepID=UPI002D7E429E|nr:methylated-DNA--[protein]-cysteine S-methyltransferase [Actinophytocola sp.]HET9142092.1 methylated-DNA--[protein]-cysteine S-methyltransferase [Actinophytocola sp.]
MNQYATIETPVGRLVLTGTAEVLDTVSFADPVHSGRYEPAAFGAARQALAAYLAGDTRRIEVPHTVRGTPFQRRVWAELDRIGYGETISYGRLAQRVGVPRTRIRAVAAAVGANPLLVIRPCHRVIGADGSLTGYAAGVWRKHGLLAAEGALQPELAWHG